MRTILSVALFVLVALAGCADTDATGTPVEPVDGVDSTDEAAPSPAGNTTIDQNATAPVEALLTIDAINGTAPLLVNFTLEGVPNGTWSLDLGDGTMIDGQGLPAMANHTYDAGEFVATLTVIDGSQTTMSSANITALVGYVSGVLLETTEWVDSGSLVAGLQWCGLQDGIDYAEYTWDASALLAQDYAVSNVVLVTTNGDTTVDIDLDFYAPDGKLIGHAGSFELPGGHETITGAGPYPAGEFVLQVSACSGVAMDFDWVMTADLVTA